MNSILIGNTMNLLTLLTKDSVKSKKYNPYKNTYGCEFIRERKEK